MSDFNPVSLFFILHETFGAWLWLLLGLALVLAAGIVMRVMKLRRAGRPPIRPMMAALVVGTIVTAAATAFVVPRWTLTDIGALGAAVDYVVAVLLALIPAAVVASLVFMMAAHRCASRHAAA